MALGKFPHEIDEQMPLEDFFKCMAMDAIEPFGAPRADIQAAMIASTIANFSGKQLKENVTMSIQDCLPNWYGEPRRPVGQQTPEEMHANFLKIFNFAKAKAERAKAS